MGKHVLILTTVSGFLCQFEKNTVEILRERGDRIYYASSFDTEEYPVDRDYFQENQIQVHPVSIRKSPLCVRENFRALKQLIALIRREKIDRIHCHNPVGGVLGRLAGKLSGRRVQVVYTAHGFHFYRGGPLPGWILFYPVEWLLAGLTDALLTINKEDTGRALRFPGKKKKIRQEIPGTGVNLKRFAPAPELREKARKELGAAEGEFCMVTAARLARDKNVGTILNVLANMRDVPFRYVICGEGPARPFLEREIQRLQLSERVTLAGFRSDLEFLLQGADVFVFPSLREGLGMAALEAMACRVPVAAADSRGTREYIRDGENGFLCNGREEETFEKILRRLWENPKMRLEMGRNAERTSRQYGGERTREKMREIYRMLDRMEERGKRRWRSR